MKKSSNNRIEKDGLSKTVEDLMQAGFTEYEARVYLSLLANHPSSAYSISQHSGVPHSRVYDISRRLIAKGYAVSTGTNPELFSPLSPDELIDKINRDHAKLTKNLEQQLKHVDFSPDFDPVWNSNSWEECMEKVGEIIKGAQKKIYIGVWLEDFFPVKEDLRRAHDRGVLVFMLIYGKTDIDFGNYFFHERDHIVGMKNVGRTIDCSADSSVCITGYLHDGGEAKVVWTRNYGLVFSIENYLIHDFFIHDITLRFEKEMDEAFGHNLIKLREKFHHMK